MKILYGDDIADGNTTATTTDASFPIANLADYNPKNVWRATAQTATLTITFSGIQFYNVALFNCNDANDTIPYRLKNGAVTVASGNLIDDTNGNFWLNVVTTSPCTSIEIDIDSGSGNIAEAGILRVALEELFEDPMTLSQSYKDFSIKKRTRNQAILRKEKDRVWIYNGTLLSPLALGLTGDGKRSGDLRLVKTCKDIAPFPVPIQLLSKNFSRFIFGEISASGSINHDATSGTVDGWFGTCNFQIEEVI